MSATIWSIIRGISGRKSRMNAAALRYVSSPRHNSIMACRQYGEWSSSTPLDASRPDGPFVVTYLPLSSVGVKDSRAVTPGIADYVHVPFPRNAGDVLPCATELATGPARIGSAQWTVHWIVRSILQWMVSSVVPDMVLTERQDARGFPYRHHRSIPRTSSIE